MSDKQLPVAHTDLVKALSKHIQTVDGKPVVDTDAYISNLTGDVTADEIKRVAEHNARFFPAATHAGGNAANAAFKADKKLDKVTVSFGMEGKDKFDITYEREHTYPGIKDRPDTTVFCAVSPKYVTQSARGSVGLMAKVRDELAEDALKAFGK